MQKGVESAGVGPFMGFSKTHRGRKNWQVENAREKIQGEGRTETAECQVNSSAAINECGLLSNLGNSEAAEGAKYQAASSIANACPS